MSIPQSGGAPIESYAQLVEYLEKGCKPISNWRIGTEHEKFGYNKQTLLPLPYDGDCSVKAILSGLRDVFGWKEVFELGKLIGLYKNGANVSLEPGGQLELSGAPLQSIHETCDEANKHLREVQHIAERIGAGHIGIGAALNWTPQQLPMMPKSRYRLIYDYMRQAGKYGTDMMFSSCTIQVNLDFSSEQDMVKKLRVALALQPVSVALFSNSPFFAGKDTGFKSWRARMWQDIDADRTGTLPFAFEDGMGFERYVDYALDVPMYFIYRNGQYLNALGQSFRDFMKGRLPALPGEMPKLSDWGDHLTTIFPEARIKQFMEMRGADGGPWRRICALPAFWVGLLYDSTALDAAWDLCKHWDLSTREALHNAAAKDGLQAKVAGISMLELAKRVLVIAHAGLKARAVVGSDGLIADETHFLDTLHDSVEREMTQADELLQKYYGEWNGDFTKIYTEYSY